MRVHLLFVAGILLVGAGCNGPDVRAESATARRVVDSAASREDELRKFRDGLPKVDSLVGGAGNRDELVAAFMRALAASDTTALVRMAVTRSEFAYLYYPTTPRAKPPYDLEPELMWFLLIQQRDQGLTRSLRHYGGTPISLMDYDCGEEASHEGENVVYGPCTVRWRGSGGDTLSVRLFNQILERGGRFKFLNYGNRLD
jgi:hypothetical protein